MHRAFVYHTSKDMKGNCTLQQIQDHIKDQQLGYFLGKHYTGKDM